MADRDLSTSVSGGASTTSASPASFITSSASPLGFVVNDLETKLSLDTEEILMDELIELAKRPDLTLQTLATAMSKMATALGVMCYSDIDSKDEFIPNIVKANNTNVLLEVDEVFHFGEGLLAKLLVAAAECGDEAAAEATVMHMRRNCGDLVTLNVIIDVVARRESSPSTSPPHLGYRGILKHLFKLQPKDSERYPMPYSGNASHEGYGEKLMRRMRLSPATHFDDLIAYLTFNTNKRVIQAMEDLLGEDMWTKPQYRSMLENYKPLDEWTTFMARGGMEYLLRKGVLPLTLHTYKVLRRRTDDVTVTSDRSSGDFRAYKDSIMSLMRYFYYARANKLVIGIPGSSDAYDKCPYLQICVQLPKLAELYIDFAEEIAYKEYPDALDKLITSLMWTGRLHSLHKLLETATPDSSHAELRPNGTLITKPSPSVTKARCAYVVRALREKDMQLELDPTTPAIATYLIYELGVAPRELQRVGCFSVFYLNETVPRSVVLWTLYQLHNSKKAGLMWEKAMREEKATEDLKHTQHDYLEEVKIEDDKNPFNQLPTSTSSSSTASSTSLSASIDAPSISSSTSSTVSSSSASGVKQAAKFKISTLPKSRSLREGFKKKPTKLQAPKTTKTSTSTSSTLPEGSYPSAVRILERDYRFLGLHLDRLVWAMDTKMMSKSRAGDLEFITFRTRDSGEAMGKETIEKLRDNIVRLSKYISLFVESLMTWCMRSSTRSQALVESNTLSFLPIDRATIVISFYGRGHYGGRAVLPVYYTMLKHYLKHAEQGSTEQGSTEDEGVGDASRVIHGLAEVCLALACIHRNEAIAKEALHLLVHHPLREGILAYTPPKFVTRWELGLLVQAAAMKSFAFLKHVFVSLQELLARISTPNASTISTTTTALSNTTATTTTTTKPKTKAKKTKKKKTSTSRSTSASQSLSRLGDWAKTLSLMHPKGNCPQFRTALQIGYASPLAVSREITVRSIQRTLYECTWNGLQFARLDHHAIMPALMWSCIGDPREVTTNAVGTSYHSAYSASRSDDAFVPIAVMRLVELIAEGNTADQVLGLKVDLSKTDVQNCRFISQAEATAEMYNDDGEIDDAFREECNMVPSVEDLFEDESTASEDFGHDEYSRDCDDDEYDDDFDFALDGDGYGSDDSIDDGYAFDVSIGDDDA